MRAFLAAWMSAGLVMGAVVAYGGGPDPQPPGKPSPLPPAKPPEPMPPRPPGQLPSANVPGWNPNWGSYRHPPWYSLPGYSYSLGSSLYVPYYGGPTLLPPWYFPPESVFGPDRWIGPHIAPLPRVEPPEDAAGPEKAPPNQRGTNAESVARARRFIAIGDRMFAERKYADAYENYRQAGVAAPRLADACFRQGFALVACGHYESAARAFKRGLDLDAAWPQSDFRLDLLYRDHGVDKATHLDMLATAAIAKPHDADLLFLTGISLHFDGQANRARPFFQRAGQLSGADAQRGKTFELPEREAATDDGPF